MGFQGPPLPALQITPYRPVDPLDQYAKIVAIRNAQQMAQQRQLEMQQTQMQMQMQQQQLRDLQTTMDVIGRHNGNMSAALPELAGKVSGPTYMKLAEFDQTYRKNKAETDANNLKVQDSAVNQLAGLVQQGQRMKPDEYLQAWPQIATQAKALHDTYVRAGGHNAPFNVDPANPYPQQQLGQIGIGLMTEKHYIDSAKEGREVQEFNAKLPAQQAEAEQKSRANAASQLGNATSQQQYAQLWGDLPAKVARNFPSPEQWTPQARDQILNAGMTPHEQASLKTQTNLDAAWIDQFKKEHNGQAPSTGDILVYQRAKRPVNNIMTANDAKDIADAIESGDQPPTLQGLYRNAGPVRAELARRGVPLAKMEMDWKATQRYVASLNGPQQLRLNQSIASVQELLPKVEALYSEWKQLAPVSGYKIANKGVLIAMKNLPGRPGAVASALDTQIAELTADLGNIYMGGNSPTDQALKLGAVALQSDWNPDTFEEGIRQAKMNVNIRANSIKHGVSMGLSGTTNYFQGGAVQPQQGGAAGGQMQPMYARNPQTNHRIVSFDGGQTWQPAQ